MSLSIILFITFSSFSDYMFKIGAVEHREVGDFNLTNYNVNDYEDRDKIYSDLKIWRMQKVYNLVTYQGGALVEEDKIDKDYPRRFDEKIEGLDYIQDVRIISIGDDNLDTLKSNLQKGIISKNKMNVENGILVLNNTKVFDFESQRHILMEAFKFKPGDEIRFSDNIDRDYEDNKDLNLMDLKVMGILDKGPLEEDYNYNGGINIIATEKVFENIEEQIGTQGQYQNYYVKMKENGNKENIIEYLDNLS